jgi:hypothetical protein
LELQLTLAFAETRWQHAGSGVAGRINIIRWETRRKYTLVENDP